VPGKVVVGPGLSLASRLVEELRRERGDAALSVMTVLVPSNLLAVRLKRVLARELDGLLNIRLRTFIDLAKAVAGPDPHGRRQALSLHQLLAVREATSVADGYFEPVAEQTGLHAAILATINDLENAGIGQHDLQQLVSSRASQRKDADADARRVSTLAAIWSKASARLAPFERVAEAFQRAAERADSAGGILGPGLIVYGFHDFTEVQLELLRAFSGAVPVTVLLADERSGDSVYAALTVANLERNGFAVEVLSRGDAPLQKVAAALFGSPRDAETMAAVDFRSAANELAEAQEVARAVVRLLAEGVSADEIAVVHHGEPYSTLLGEVFSRANLLHFRADGERASETRFGKALFLLFRLVGSELRRGDVLEFVSHAPLREELLGPSGQDYWEALTRRAAVVSSRAQWDKRLRAYHDELLARIGRDDPGSEQRTWLERRLASLTHLRAFTTGLFDDLEQVDVIASWTDHVGHLHALIEKYLAATIDDESCVDALQELSSLDAISGPQPFSVFRELAEHTLSGTFLQEGKVGRGHIFVGAPRDIRGMSFQHVFVVGLAERSFPPPQPVDSVLLERDRQELARLTSRHLRTASAGINEERLLFSGAVAAAQNVHLSYPRLELEKARVRYPSPFLLGLAEAVNGKPYDWQLTDLPNHHAVGLRSDSVAPTDALWIEQYDISTATSVGFGEGLSFLDSVSRHHSRRRAATICRSKTSQFTRYDGMIRKTEGRAAVAAYLEEALLSPTSLEHYARCPQRFFLRSLLGLEALEEPESVADLSPLDRGSIVHAVLERFFKGLHNDGELPLRRTLAPQYIDRLTRDAETEFAAAQERGVTGLLVAWRAHSRFLLEDLVRFLEVELANASGGLTPSHFEFGFGRPGEAPSLQVSLVANRRLHFGGRIDRIDVGDGHAGVVDYKSGTHVASKNGAEVSFDGGKQLQLPIYLMAAAQALDLAEDQVDASYHHVNRRAVFRRIRLTGESFGPRKRAFFSLLEGMSDAMREGVFVPQTEEGENCRSCDFRTVCPAAVRHQEERKADDPALQYLAQFQRIK
jgi:ATP-dependent helicase/nuclease subunit B